MPDIRILKPGDEAALEAFLLPRVESSMFLLSNMRAGGLLEQGRPYQGTYAAAFHGPAIVAVAAHYWNGNLVLQAPAHLGSVVRAVLAASRQPVQGMIGPGDQVQVARELLAIGPDAVQWDEQENLYTLALADLRVPEPLRTGAVRARRGEARDLALLTAWRVAMRVESMNEEDTPELRRSTRAGVQRGLDQRAVWILEVDGRPVSTSAFNAALPEAVQVGGVWTPHEERSRGYARAVVAASLLDTRAEGAATAILFTGQDNWPAQKAYIALGFRHTGEYRLLLLRQAY